MLRQILNRLFNRSDIANCEGDLYLTRWYVLRFRLFAIFVHRFERSDEDRALHDHPWPFIVIPLWGGYIEHYMKRSVFRFSTGVKHVSLWKARRRIRPILGIGFKPATYAHRVELINGRPSWSIFIRFRACRTWGYLMPEEWVSHKRWWKQHGCVEEKQNQGN